MGTETGHDSLSTAAFTAFTALNGTAVYTVCLYSSARVVSTSIPSGREGAAHQVAEPTKTAAEEAPTRSDMAETNNQLGAR